MALFSKDSNVKVLFFLALILVLASSLRFYGMTSNGLWIDETISYDVVSDKTFSSIIQNTIKSQSWPPLYYFFLDASVMIFGKSEFAMRVPSVFFGILAVISIFYLARFVFGLNVAIISSLLASVNQFQIFYSHNARPYSLVFLLSILATYFFLKFLLEKKLKPLIWYCLFSVMLLYTHYLALLLLFFHFLYALFYFFQKREFANFKYFIFSCIAIFIFYLPWLLIFISHLSYRVSGNFAHWIGKPSLQEFFNILVYFSGTKEIFFLFLIAVLFVFFGISGHGITLKKLSYNELFILLWLIIPILFNFLLSFTFESYFIERYLIFVSPALYVLVARGISGIRQVSIRIIYSLLLLCFCLAGTLTSFSYNPMGEDWRDPINYINQKEKPGDYIFMWGGEIIGSFLDSPLKFYYTGSNKFYGLNIDPAMDAEAFKGASDYGRVWFIDRSQVLNSLHKEFFDSALESYHISDQKVFSGVVVYLYERD
jgi:uncharacterized membrane protein